MGEPAPGVPTRRVDGHPRGTAPWTAAPRPNSQTETSSPQRGPQSRPQSRSRRSAARVHCRRGWVHIPCALVLPLAYAHFPPTLTLSRLTRTSALSRLTRRLHVGKTASPPNE